ncbi:MAG: MmgE/PrpD family protein [Dehalococcoidia bacterium]
MTQTLSKTDLANGATRRLAEYAASLQFEQLPPELVELTKRCILDTLGVTAGASSLAEEGRLTYEYVKELGGKPEASILGFGGKAPAAWATFVNGSLGHMLDYDDVGGGHVSIPTVLPAFAIAEKLGGVSGKELITAIAVGTDIMVRLDRAIPLHDWTMTEGWFATQLFGFVAGAAVAGRLLHLDADQMENALGIGFNQMSGSRQMAVGEATHMRSMQAGFCGQGAITAALLAQKGITGPKAFLEGRYGLFRTYVRAEDPDWNELVGELGTRFRLLETHGFKVWPSCGYTRPTNAAVIEMLSEGLKKEDVESVVIAGGTGGTQLLSEPAELKRRPQLSIDAKYSIPFTTAIALAKGTVALRHYTDEALHDPEVLAMADRISYRAIPEDQKTSKAPIVEVTTRDGRVISKQMETVPGDAKSPVGWPEIEAKFRDTISFSRHPLSSDDVDRAIALVRRLEGSVDATKVIRLLAGT